MDQEPIQQNTHSERESIMDNEQIIQDESGEEGNEMMIEEGREEDMTDFNQKIAEYRSLIRLKSMMRKTPIQTMNRRYKKLEEVRSPQAS